MKNQINSDLLKALMKEKENQKRIDKKEILFFAVICFIIGLSVGATIVSLLK